MSNNPNHPIKGSNVTVQPIRELKDIRAISKLLEGSPRNRLLFITGINNGLRCSDLLKLKVADVKNLKVGETLTIKENKTGKANIFAVNKSVYKALKNYLATSRPGADGYLFASRKGDGPLQTIAVNKLIKSWARAVNLKGNYGANSLRKSWGYHQRVNFGVPVELLCKRYNHSSPAITFRYIGIEDKEIHNILMNEIS